MLPIQHWQSIKAFAAPQELGRDTHGTADPSWSKEYCRPPSIMFSNKMRGNLGRGDTAWGQDGINQLLICLTCLSRVLFLSLSYFHCSLIVAITIVASAIKPLTSHPMSFLTFTLPIHFLHPAAAEKSGSACVVLRWTTTLLFQTAAFFLSPHSITQQICLVIPCVCQTYLFNLFSKHKSFL